MLCVVDVPYLHPPPKATKTEARCHRGRQTELTEHQHNEMSSRIKREEGRASGETEQRKEDQR